MSRGLQVAEIARRANRAGGVSATWHEDMTENLAHLHPKKYGRIGKGDSFGLHLQDRAAYALQSRGSDGVEAMAASAQEMIDDYVTQSQVGSEN